MGRSLGLRERVLLVLVVLVAVGFAFWNFWIAPIQHELSGLAAQENQLQMQITASKNQVSELSQMEKELEALRAQNDNGSTLPAYDNLPVLMQELNSVLGKASTFSLSFGNVDTSSQIVTRSVTLTYSSSSYAQALEILSQLRYGKERCVIENVSISLGNSLGIQSSSSQSALPTRASAATVNATLKFFEYKG